MNRRIFLTSVSAFSLLFISGCIPSKEKVATSKDNSASSHEHERGYWTCTMHPQVHKNEPGKCPICGMPLVHVDKKVHTERTETVKTDSGGVNPSDAQVKNANISKYIVVKKDFITAIAFSGRLTSARDISLQIYESDRALVKPNMVISGYSSVKPSEIKKGKIIHLDNFIDPSSRTIRVSAVLDSGVSDYVSDSSFYGQIQSTIKNQIVVPDEAILHAGKRDLVYVFNQAGMLEPREVTLGQKSKSEYQVLSGLNEGDVISAGANFLIDSEAKIRGL